MCGVWGAGAEEVCMGEGHNCSSKWKMVPAGQGARARESAGQGVEGSGVRARGSAGRAGVRGRRVQGEGKGKCETGGGGEGKGEYGTGGRVEGEGECGERECGAGIGGVGA